MGDDAPSWDGGKVRGCWWLEVWEQVRLAVGREALGLSELSELNSNWLMQSNGYGRRESPVRRTQGCVAVVGGTISLFRMGKMSNIDEPGTSASGSG